MKRALIKTFPINQKNSDKQLEWITSVVDECPSVNCVINNTSGILTSPAPCTSLIFKWAGLEGHKNRYCYHFISPHRSFCGPAASSRGGTVWPPKMEHNRCIGNAARRSPRRNRRLFSLHKSLAAMVQMIVQAGGHSEAITYSPVGGLAPVIVLRPAGGGGHTVMPGWAQQHRINEPASCTGKDTRLCV